MEGRVQRTREYNESLMRSVVTGEPGSQIPPNHKSEGSVNQGVLSPSSMAVFVGTEGLEGQGVGSSGKIFEGGGWFGNYSGEMARVMEG